MTESIQEHWTISKPAVTSSKGMVASQHYLASEAGAGVLRAGGNAVDAAVATGLVLGTVEPWMSGIGGGGYMTVYTAVTGKTQVIEFGMRAPLKAEASDYPLAPSGTNSADSFNWPSVTGDTNIHGPLSVAVPGYIKGIATALEKYGTWHFTDVIEPACRQAEAGLPIDWFSAQKINHFARGLAMYPQTKSIYLADGLPPVANLDGSLARLKLGNLANTYRTLQEKGPADYYTGELATSIVADLQAAGSKISLKDLAEYTVNIDEPLTTNYRGAELFVSGNLTAGPSIIYALNHLERTFTPAAQSPDAAAYQAYADSLFAAYEHRLKHLGEGPHNPEKDNPGNTSHVCVVDQAGNVVSLTQTIMSAFGSRVMLPLSGILMNNGMMWFDPRPGGPNSVVGGRRPLCNMCPVILQLPGGGRVAIGACGGRKIFPAVYQLAAFQVDYNLGVHDAAHLPRLDVSGTELVTLMDHLDPGIISELSAHYPEVAVRPNGVNPNLFALPQMIRRDPDGSMTGACFIPSPHARVVAAD